MAKYSGKTFGSSGGGSKDPFKAPEKLKLNIKKFNPGKSLSIMSFHLPFAWKNLKKRFSGFYSGRKNSSDRSFSFPSREKSTAGRSLGFPSAGKNAAGRFSGFSSAGKSLSIKSFNISSGRINGIFSGIADLFRSAFTNFPEFFRNYRTIILGVGAGCIFAFIIILIMDFSKVRALATYQPDVTTRIYDKNNILIGEIFSEKREVVPYDRIPQNLKNAFIAMEDTEFYDHWGINPKGIVRAFFVNIFSGSIRQGGSTITQQLAKVMLTSGERSLYRKIKEAFISLMIEATFSKDEILNLYLNQIFLGHGAYGVQSAAKLYFGKDVWNLNLAECSLLATLPAAPNMLSPIKYPRTAWTRHRVALSRMVEMGYITVPEGEKAYMDFWPDFLYKIQDMSPTLNAFSSRINNAPWFTEYIRRDLVKKYGEETVYSGGLSVYTTLDINKQTAGQRILKDALDRQSSVSSGLSFNNEEYVMNHFSDEISLASYILNTPPFKRKGSVENSRFNSHVRANVVEELEGINFLAGFDNIGEFIDKYKSTYSEDREMQRVEGCIISINQQNGYIEAMVGGGEFSSINQLNRTMQSKRQPGSAIKPLLYAAAIESGKFTASTTVLDSPIVYLDMEGSDWMPENYEGEYYGFVRIRRALEKSINVISIRIAEAIGIDMVINYYAKLLKFNNDEKKERIPRNFSIALGSIEVSPFEITRAYAIIANGGRDVIPFAVRYIKDRNGNIIENREQEISSMLMEEAKKGTIQIIRPETAQVMISLMRSVISAGTAKLAYPGRPAAGKTGTTNNWKDAWFIGFTANVTTGIWMGYDKMGLSLGTGQAAAGIVAPVWGNYMRSALVNDPVMEFPVYAGLLQINVCANSGLLPGPLCREQISEVFIPGFVPDKQCDLCNGSNPSSLPSKGPDDNIVEDQKKKIRGNIRETRKESIIKNIENDLLQ
ncbi:MAG TPA: PBP1A family penicillin-binding protein [Spirochaetota bacterium]|nr:PBP1A family penicillin-binding protein [Spirochaetota bacterium]